MTKSKAVKCIINVMCNKGFMNGWCGDTSEGFRMDQLNYYMYMSIEQQMEWIERNHFNLTHYCRIPVHVLVAAQEQEGSWH